MSCVEKIMASTFSKDVVLEHSAVSGFLYVTVDKELLLSQKFDEHVKVKIVFDKRDEIAEEENIGRKDDKVENKPMINTDFIEEEVFLVDDSSINSGDESDVCNSKNLPLPVSKAQQDYSNQQRKRVKKNAVSHVLVSNKISSLETTQKTNSHTKLTAVENIKTEKSEIVEQEKTELNSNETSHIDHMGKRKRTEIKEDTFCSYCSKSFKSRREFRNHQRNETKNYKCEKCYKVFRFEAHLLIHMHEHEILEAIETTNSESLEPFFRSDQSSSEDIEKKRKKCCVCGLFMSNMANLKLHVMVHTGEYAYKCCVCGQLTRTTAPHKKHMTKHLKETQFLCKICNIPFESRGDLCSHQLTHTFPCNLCGKVFTNKTGRYFHYRTFHKSDILKCHLCGRLYSCKNALASHLKYHRNRRRSQCPVCGDFVFRLKKHMLSHTQSSDGHDESDLYVCDKCPKQFKNRQSFSRHLRVHSEEKPYKCCECSKQFALSGGLNRHMKTHMTQKPYVCEICGKSCSQMGNLRIHMRTHRERNTEYKKNIQQQPIITEPPFEGSRML